MKNRIFRLFLCAGVSLGTLLPASAGTDAPPAPQETSSAVASSPEPQLQKALHDLEKGDWLGARSRAEAFISKHKDSPEAWALLGRTYLPAMKYKKAINRF